MAQKNYSDIFLPMEDIILERLKHTSERKLSSQLQEEILEEYRGEE